MLSITAIGLLDTKLPDGKEGFSFLIIITCNFPPIQLGYGFVLSGLGGLAGINRSIVVKALQDGVHSGSVEHILFPEDPVAHAAELITDLETILPPKAGQYVFGPMAELGWGVPDPLITAQLGIILILPNPLVIVLLGKLAVTLPEPESPVVDLKMQIAGSLDVTNKLLAIDMSLEGSRILAWSLGGDVALRLSFGAQPNFAFAMGGFHPHFQPPPDFPALTRLSLSLSTGDNPRLSFDVYLAVTANTVQVGAKALAYVKFGDFSASGDLGFDALFHFQPFSFIVDLEANLSVNGPAGFSASVHFDGHLSGLDPVRCWGLVVIHFLGTHKFPIDIPFGEPIEETPTPLPDPWGQLQRDRPHRELERRVARGRSAARRRRAEPGHRHARVRRSVRRLDASAEDAAARSRPQQVRRGPARRAGAIRHQHRRRRAAGVRRRRDDACQRSVRGRAIRTVE